jgi:hypothetical protein
MAAVSMADTATTTLPSRWSVALVLALDQDDAGRRVADALAVELGAQRRSSTYLPIPNGSST